MIKKKSPEIPLEKSRSVVGADWSAFWRNKLALWAVDGREIGAGRSLAGGGDKPRLRRVLIGPC